MIRHGRSLFSLSHHKKLWIRYYYASLLNVVLRLSNDTYYGFKFPPSRVVRAFTVAGSCSPSLLCCASSGIAYAQDDNGDGVKVYQSDEGNSIIPKPDSGVAP